MFGDPYFSFEKHFIYNYLRIVQKLTKNQCGKLKNFQDFCPRDMESCNLAAASRMKLWSLNANLFLKKPQQLRTVPTNSKVFLRGLLNMWEKQILTSDIEIQKENWG